MHRLVGQWLFRVWEAAAFDRPCTYTSAPAGRSLARRRTPSGSAGTRPSLGCSIDPVRWAERAARPCRYAIRPWVGQERRILPGRRRSCSAPAGWRPWRRRRWRRRWRRRRRCSDAALTGGCRGSVLALSLLSLTGGWRSADAAWIQVSREGRAAEEIDRSDRAPVACGSTAGRRWITSNGSRGR